MLITKFNAMIRNRILWGIFAVIVSISFLGFIGPRNGCRRMQSQRNPDTVGKLNGEMITERELHMARFFEMGLRDGNAPRTAKGAAELRSRSWRRIAALRTAARFGIQVSDNEMRDVIQRDPSFKANGVFNRDRYVTVIQNQLRVGVDIFEAYLRESLTLRKLVDVLQSAAWTAPSEVQQRLGNLTDSNTVVYVALTNDADRISVSVSEADAKAFYEVHTNLFVIPDQVSVKYVAFAVTNALFPNDIGDAEIKSYYDEHLDAYSTTDTNETSQPLPLADVKEKIRLTLAQAAAAEKTRDAATDFAIRLLPDPNGNAADFEKVAAASNLVVCTTAFFSVMGDVAGLALGREGKLASPRGESPDRSGLSELAAFKHAAFRLDASDPERRFSDPVVASNAVYVLAAHDRKDSYLADFDEVKAAAMSAARSNAQHKAYVDKVKGIRTEVVAAVESGKTFSDAVKGLGMNAVTVTPFAVYECFSSNIFEYADVIAPKLAWMKKGQVSDPLRTETGVLVVYLADRTPGDFSVVEMFRPQLLNTLQNHRAGILFEDWAAHLLTEGKLEDYRAVEVGKAESEAEEGTNEPPPPRKPGRDRLQELL